jgi:hypothetical protein
MEMDLFVAVLLPSPTKKITFIFKFWGEFMFKNFVFLWLSLTFSFSSLAGSSVGNGGIGIICETKDGTITSVELLDYLEGIFLESYTYTQLSNQNAMENIVIQRLSEISPKRAAVYKTQLEHFFKESIFKPGVEILDPEDSYHYINRKGCKHKTLILQLRHSIPGTPKFIINADYFPLLSHLEKTMLLFHEIIYREAIAIGHEDSRFTRAFTAFLFSDQWEAQKANVLPKLFKRFDFPKEYGEWRYK